MRKMLRTCVLVMAIACTVHAGEMQNGIAGEIQNDAASQTTDVRTEILGLLGNLLSLL
jgi:hypothetical protein